jgi:Uma2 family endonuclease
VVEVLSPGPSVRSQLDRCRELVSHGVRVAVFVDPGRKSVYVVRPGHEIGQLGEGDSIDLKEIFEGFELAAAKIFAHARPGRRR